MFNVGSSILTHILLVGGGHPCMGGGRGHMGLSDINIPQFIYESKTALIK
jgi:hypothetical protein